MFESIFKLLFPRYCINCFKSGESICKKCQKEELQKFQPECHVCRKVTNREYYIHKNCRDRTTLEGVSILFHYNDLVGKIIKDYKYNGFYKIGEELSDLLLSYSTFPKLDTITFVPLHKSRIRSRGFNQSEIIAIQISNVLNVNVSKLVERVLNTKKQSLLNKSEREENLSGAFKFIEQEKAIKSCLIIDDIYTTGSTLEACAKVLKENGVEQVYGMVFSRR